MKSGIARTMAFTLLLAMAVPLQIMAEEPLLETPVIEAVYQEPYDVQAGPGAVLEMDTALAENNGLESAEAAAVQQVEPETIAVQQAEVETEVSEDKPVSTEPSYTQDDLEVLAHAICGEAQSYPDEEQLYVGSVIINRKNHKAYPNTIRGVVFQRGQYACTWDGNYYRQPTQANYRNAQWLLENGSILPGNVVYQASFKQGSGVYLRTKYHRYCYY